MSYDTPVLDNLIVDDMTIHTDDLDIYVYAFKTAEYPVGVMSIHNCYEIHHAVDSRAEIILEDKTISLVSGDILWLFPGTKHKTVIDSPNDGHFLILFDIKCRKPDASNKKQTPPNLSKLIEKKNDYWIGFDFSGLSAYLLEIVKLSESKKWGYHSQIQCLIALYILKCLRDVIGEEQITVKKQLKAAYSSNSFPMLSYIKENFNKPLTLETLSKEFHLSPRQINRNIQEHFGLTFKRILLDVRIEYAKLYLKNTEYSTEQVCEFVGFESAPYFQKVFKSVVGQTIAEYKKSTKGTL